MPLEISLQLTPEQAADKAKYVAIAARIAGVRQSQIALARVLKRSIDARQKRIKVNMTVQLYVDGEPMPAPVKFNYRDVSGGREVVVVGAGPAGLFASLRLIEHGFRPIIVERGKPVSERKIDIAEINRNGTLNPDSNYAFGEGGAGTFSDGKLFTRSKKRGDYNKALQTLVYHGADEEILYDSHPHIGTDKLPSIISAIRKTIEDCGGQVHFNTRVTNIVVKDGRATGVMCGERRIDGHAVVLATGHSARDVYHALYADNILLEAKPFAMGVRIEHPQALIDSIQYHRPERGEYLPAASYSLVTQVGGRGVYSFCMCPGGFIVPAMTEPTGCVVNGMSPSHRGSPFANSGIVTEIREADYAHLTADYGVLAGLEFQRLFEEAARTNGGDAQHAPAQRVADFVAGKRSQSLPQSSYVPGLISSEMGEWMPRFIAESLRKGLSDFGHKMRGFVTNEALVAGVESRTSTPVRIPRDRETLEHIAIKGLYPAGEGAGYAGGIISAALDGERVADAIAGKLE